MPSIFREAALEVLHGPAIESVEHFFLTSAHVEAISQADLPDRSTTPDYGVYQIGDV